jgi:ParB family chromosome partitioning protein
MSVALENWRYVREALARDPCPTHEEIAAELGLRRSRISNLARLLSLPANVLVLIDDGRLSPKAGEWLLRLRASEQWQVADQAARERWTIERLKIAIERRQGKRGDDEPHADPDLASLETAVGELLGTNVQVDYRADGTGWLKIKFSSLDTLDGVLERIGYRG